MRLYKKITLALSFLVVSVGVFLISSQIQGILDQYFQKKPNLHFQKSELIDESTTFEDIPPIEKAEGEIEAPQPMRNFPVSAEKDNSTENSIGENIDVIPHDEGNHEDYLPLTRAGIIAWTNRKRAQSQLANLSENTYLNASAEEKVNDMFTKQYFAHESPDGKLASDIVKKNGYTYLSVGENLALGWYKNDEALVTSWMDSPGHRENILKSHYSEIGVSARKGVFDGQEVWIAVQIFARPESACVKPDENMKRIVEINQKKLEKMQDELDKMAKEIENFDTKTGSIKNFNNLVDEYNAYVEDYNALIKEVKKASDTYNNQVKSYNECLGT